MYSNGQKLNLARITLKGADLSPPPPPPLSLLGIQWLGKSCYCFLLERDKTEAGKLGAPARKTTAALRTNVWINPLPTLNRVVDAFLHTKREEGQSKQPVHADS